MTVNKRRPVVAEMKRRLNQSIVQAIDVADVPISSRANSISVDRKAVAGDETAIFLSRKEASRWLI
jgi:hypothetical protein